MAETARERLARLKKEEEEEQAKLAQYQEKEAKATAEYLQQQKKEQQDQQSAEIAARLDTETQEENEQSAQVAARLDQTISSPTLDYAIDSWTDAYAARNLDNGNYAATGGTKQKEIAQRAREYKESLKSAQAAANLDNSLMTQATRDKRIEELRAAVDSAYNRLEGYKNNGQTEELAKAERQYKLLDDSLQRSKITAAMAESAEWENERFNEIMSTNDRTLMLNLERLVDLTNTKTEEAAERGDERRNGLSETEKRYNEIYSYLTSKYGDQVDGWIEYAKRMDNRSKMYASEEKARKAAEEKPFWSSVGSIPLNAFSGAGYLDVVGQKMQRGITGSNAPIDYNSRAQTASKMTNTIRGTVSEDMGTVGSLLYNTAMSMGDTLLAMPLGNAGMAILGASAATNAMQEAVERGATDDQALMVGLVSGGVEALMEKASIDSLFKLKDAKNLGGVVLNVLKQGGAEAAEENLTTIANTIADAIIMGDESQLQTNKRNLMAQGISEDEAEKMVIRDWAINLGLDTLAGGLSGGLFGTAASVNSYASSKLDADVPSVQQRQNTAQAKVDAVMPQIQQKQTQQNEQTGQPQQATQASQPVQRPAQTSAVAPTTQVEQDAAVAATMPNMQQTTPIAEFRQTASEILNDGIFDSPIYGEALEQTDLKRSDVREALRAVARNNIAAASDPKVQTVLDAIQKVDARTAEAQAKAPTQTTPEQAASEVVSRVAGKNENTTNTAPEMQADVRRNEQGVNPAMGAVGDMGAKTSDYRHEVEESRSKTTPDYYERHNIPEEGRADNHYTVRHWDEAKANARARLEQDYDGEVDELQRVTAWSDEQVFEAAAILDDLRKKAEETGVWSEHRKWSKVFNQHKEELGRALSSLRSLTRDTSDTILADAAEALENARRGTDTDAVMQEVNAYANRYDAASENKDIDGFVQIIKDCAITRHTASLFGNKMSKLQNWALNRIAGYAKQAASETGGTFATGGKAAPIAFKVGDVVQALDRSNYGHITRVNGDGTYDVHFKSKSGSEQTVTFAGNDLISTKARTPTGGSVATEPGAAYEWLKHFAANSIRSVASDYEKVSAADVALTIRRNSLLSKAATVFRNLVGNGGFNPIDSFAKTIGTPLDMWLSKKTGTRSVTADKGTFSKESVRGGLDGLAASILSAGLDVNADVSSTYTSDRTFKMSRGPVSKLLSTWEKMTAYRMVVPDEITKGSTEARVQAPIDKLYIENKIKDDSLKDAGRQEAKYRTFQGDSKLAEATGSVKRGMNKFEVGGVGAGDFLLPFSQVGSNLASVAGDYSPVNIVRGLKDIQSVLSKAKKGDLTAKEQADAVKRLSRGFTGGMMVAAATALARVGIIKILNPGGDEEHKDKTASEKAKGRYGTQLNLDALGRWLDGKSAQWEASDDLDSIEFLEPFNAFFVIGAMIAEEWEMEDKLTFKNVFSNSIYGTIQAVMDLPLMDTIRDVKYAYQNSDGKNDGEKAGDALITLVAESVPSFIPNALRGIAEGIDPYERDLYSKDTLIGQTVDGILGSIPFARQLLPRKQDVYGNDIKNEDAVMNFLNNTVMPGSHTKYTETELQKSLDMLSEETGEYTMYLSKDPPKYITVDGERIDLTYDQKRQFMSERGDTYEFASAALENDETYKGFSKEWKQNAYEFAEDYAVQTAKDSLGTKFKPDPWVSDLKGASPEEFAEAVVQRVVASMAKKAGENEYLGLETLLDNKSIDDQIALACLSDPAREAYMTHREKADISVQQFLDVYGSAVAAGEKTADQKQYVLDTVAAMGITTAEKSALARAACQAIGSAKIPQQWFVEIGDNRAIIDQMDDEEREKYNSYIKNSKVNMATYVDFAEYCSSEEAKAKTDVAGNEIQGESRQDHIERYLNDNIKSDAEKARLFCTQFSENSCPKDWFIDAFGVEKAEEYINSAYKEKYETYVKDKLSDPVHYFELEKYITSDQEKADRRPGEEKQAHIKRWIANLNISEEEKDALFCGFYAAKNCPSDWNEWKD